MNHIYKVVFCKATNTFVAVTEYARAQGKSSSGTVGSTSKPVSSGKFAKFAATTLTTAVLSTMAMVSHASIHDTSTGTNIAIAANASTPASTTDASSNSIVLGNNAYAPGNQSIVIGHNASSAFKGGKNTNAKVEGVVVIGGGAKYLETTQGVRHVLRGNPANTLFGDSGEFVHTGLGKKAKIFTPTGGGANSVTFEGDVLATNNGVVFQRDNGAYPTVGTIVGRNAAGGVGSVVVGDTSYAAGTGVAVGSLAYAEGIGGVSIGPGAYTGGNTAIAIGRQAGTKQGADFATSIGANAAATGFSSFALGHSATSGGLGSIAIGSANFLEADATVGSSGSQFGTRYITDGHHAKASNMHSVALGTVAQATSHGAMAVGAYTKASEQLSLATGYRAQATGKSATAQGEGAVASASHAYAAGSNTHATGEKSTAVGNIAVAAKSGAVAIGSKAFAGINVDISAKEQALEAAETELFTAEKKYESALVAQQDADVQYKKKLTLNANDKKQAEAEKAALDKAAETYKTAKDDLVAKRKTYQEAKKAFDSALTNAAGSGENSIAIGTGAIAANNNSISIGTGNVVTGENSGAIGDPSYISGTGTYTIGNNNGTQAAPISANNAGAFGNQNALTGDNSRIVGNNNTVSTTDTFVVGSNVTTTATNSVFLGKDSAYVAKGGSTAGLEKAGDATVADSKGGNVTYSNAGFAGNADTTTGVVSVGATGKERRIQNVAAGAISATSTDAINGSQLYVIAEDLTKWADGNTAALGGNASYNPTNNTYTAPTYTIYKGSETPNTIGSSTTTPFGDPANNVGEAITNLNTYINQGFNVQDNGGSTKGVVTPGESIRFVNGASGLIQSKVEQEANGVTKVSFDVNRSTGLWTVASSNKDGLSVTSEAVPFGSTVTFKPSDALVSTSLDANGGTNPRVSIGLNTMGSMVLGYDKGKATGAADQSGTPDLVVTGKKLAEAINNTGFRVQAVQGSGELANGLAEYEPALIKSGYVVQFEAGDNVTLEQTNRKIVINAKNDVKTGTINVDAAGTVSANTASGDLATVDNVAAAINQAGFKVAENGTAKPDLVNAGDTLNFKNGKGTTAKVDGHNVSYNINTTTAPTVTNGVVGKPTTGGDNSFLTTNQVVDAINNSGFTLKTSANGGERESGTDELINSGDVVDIAAGKNLSVKQDTNGKITLKTKDEVTFTNITVPTAGTNNVVINNDGINAGNKPITNVVSQVPKHDDAPKAGLLNLTGATTSNAATVGDLQNMGWIVESNKTTGTTVGAATDADYTAQVKNAQQVKFVGTGEATVSGKTENGVNTITVHVAKPETTALEIGTSDNAGNNQTVATTPKGKVVTPAGDENNLVTAKNVADTINNAGFKVAQNGEAKNDLVNAGDTVDFVDGNNTTANVTTTSTGTTVKFDVKTAPALTAETGSNAGKITAPADNAGLTTAKNVADAINASGFTLKTSATADGSKDTSSTGDELINPGDSVEMVAGKNLTVKQEANGKVTYATKDDVQFTSVQLGNEGPKLANDNKGNIKVGDKDGNNPVSVTNLKGNLTPTYNEGDHQETNGKLGTTPATPNEVTKKQDAPGVAQVGDIYNNAATVGDVLNAGWNLKENGTDKDFVKPYDTVEFVNGTGTTVVIDTAADGKSSTVKVNVNTTDLKVSDGKADNATDGSTQVGDAGKVVAPQKADENNLVTAKNVADTINNAGFKVSANGTKKSDDELVNAGDTLNFADGQNTTVTAEGNTITVNVVADGVLEPKKAGSPEQPTGLIAPKAGDENKLVNAKTVADAINASGFTLKTSATADGTKVSGDDELINPSETVEMVAGKNLTVKQEANGKVTYATKDDVTFNNVNTTTLSIGDTVQADKPVVNFKAEKATPATNNQTGKEPTAALNITSKDDKPTQLTGVGSVLNITPVATRPAGNDATANLVNLGTDKAPLADTVLNSAATVRDIANLGWVVSSDNTTDASGAYKDVVKNANEVKFVGKNAAKVSGKTDENGIRTITVDVEATKVETADIATNTAGNVTGPVADAANLQKAISDAQKALDAAKTANKPADEIKQAEDVLAAANKAYDDAGGNKVATAQNVADAINASGFTLKTSATADGTKVSGDDELINPSETVEMVAGKNLTVKQEANGKVTYATKDDVQFNSVQLGNDTGPKLTNDGGNIKVGNKDGNPVSITNVAKGADVYKAGDTVHGQPIANQPKVEGLTNLEQAPEGNALTVADAKNMGWVVSATDDSKKSYSEQVKNANEVKFVGKNGTQVTGETDANGVRTISIEAVHKVIGSNTVEGASNITVNAVDELDANGQPIKDSAGNNVKKFVVSADTTPLTNNNDGKVEAPAKPNALVDAENVANAINNAGFKVADGKGNTSDLVKAGDTLNFIDGANTKTVIAKDKDGKPTVAVNVTGLPVQYTDANGNPVAKVGDNFYPVKEDGTPNTAVTPVAKDTIVTNVINPNAKPNEKGNPIKLGNVQSNLPDTYNTNAYNTGKAPVTKEQTLPTGLTVSNVATVGDVLNAGWNLQNNGEAKDFVKPYDTVNFVNGEGTKAMVATDDKGEVSKVWYDVNVDGTTTEITYVKADGTPVYKHTDGNYYTEKGGKGTKLGDVDAAKVTSRISAIGGGAAAPATTTLTVSTAPTTANNNTPAGKVETPAEADKFVTAGDIANAVNDSYWTLVNKDETVKSPVKAGTTVKFVDGKGTESVVDTTSGSPVVSFNVATTTFGKEPNGVKDGKVIVPAGDEANKFVTAGDIANAINNVGFTAKANADTGEFINAGDEVNFVDGKNITITRDKANFKVATKDDVSFNSVQFGTGPKLASDDAGNIKVSGPNGSSPVKIANVAAGTEATDAVNVSQLNAAKTKVVAGRNVESVDHDEATNTYTINVKQPSIINGNVGSVKANPDGKVAIGDTTKAGDAASATSVAEAINNSGWKVSGDGKDPQLVNPGDQVDFVKGQGTQVHVETKGDKTTIRVDSPLAYVNADKTDESTPSDVVKFVGDKPVQAQNVASGVRKADGTTPAGSERAKAISSASGDTLNNAVNVGDLQAVAKASVTNVTSKDGSIDVNETTDPATGAKSFDVAVANTGLTVATGTTATPKGKIEAPSATDGKKYVNAQDLANAINDSGFTVKANGEKDGELVNAGDVVDFVAGDNMAVTRDGTKFTFATKKEVNFDGITVPTDPTNPANSPITINKDGISAGNKPITNVNNGLTQYPGQPGVTNPKGGLVNLEVPVSGVPAVANSTVATVGDLRNMGWVVSAPKVTGGTGAYTDQVRNANEVEFVGVDGVTVSGKTDGNKRIITISGTSAGAGTGTGGSGGISAGSDLDAAKPVPSNTVVNGVGTTATVVPDKNNANVNVLKIDSPMAYVNKNGSDQSTPSDVVTMVGSVQGEPVQIQNVASAVYDPKTKQTPKVGKERADAIVQAMKGATAESPMANYAVNMGDLHSVAEVARTEVKAGENITVDVSKGERGQDVYTINAKLPDFSKIADDANAGTSSAMAMAALPQAYIPGKSMVTGGVASYNGEGAVAVGLSKLSDNGRWVLKMSGSADTRGNVGGAVGAGFHF